MTLSAVPGEIRMTLRAVSREIRRCIQIYERLSVVHVGISRWECARVIRVLETVSLADRETLYPLT